MLCRNGMLTYLPVWWKINEHKCSFLTCWTQGQGAGEECRIKQWEQKASERSRCHPGAFSPGISKKQQLVLRWNFRSLRLAIFHEHQAILGTTKEENPTNFKARASALSLFHAAVGGPGNTDLILYFLLWIQCPGLLENQSSWSIRGSVLTCVCQSGWKNGINQYLFASLKLTVRLCLGHMTRISVILYIFPCKL